MTAFQATFSDFRLVKGRKVCQLVFEVPIEAADMALQTLGGLPRPDQEAWVGIARIDPKKAANDAPKPGGEPKERRRFVELSLAAQAGLRCNEKAFWKFLTDEMNYVNIDSETEAAEAVRDICGVESRAAIRDGEPSGRRWDRLNADYVNWMHPA